MTERALYLHETVDIKGLNAGPYMEHTFGAAGEEKPNFELQGTWYTMGITGRWPQVVNIWDVPGGWDGWRSAVQKLNLARPANKKLEEWWKKAFEYRTGGYDRLLAAAPGCPSTESLVEDGVRGTLFVHEITEVQPGAQMDYLNATEEIREPLMAEYGHLLTGLYEVTFNDYEVITTWATDPNDHVMLGRANEVARGLSAGHADDRLVDWGKAARKYATRRREELMTPYPGTKLGPPAEEKES